MLIKFLVLFPQIRLEKLHRMIYGFCVIFCRTEFFPPQSAQSREKTFHFQWEMKIYFLHTSLKKVMTIYHGSFRNLKKNNERQGFVWVEVLEF